MEPVNGHPYAPDGMGELQPPPIADALHSVEAEKAVIAACISGPQYAASAARMLNPDDFVNQTRRLVFEAVQKCAETGAPIELRSMMQVMQDLGTLHKAGGAYAISPYVETGRHSTGEALDHYVDVLKGKTLRRRLDGCAPILEALARDTSLSETEVISAAESVISGVAKGTLQQKGIDIGVSARALYERLLNPPGPDDGWYLRTGIGVLDDHFGGGLRRSWNVVVLGAPGHGKSALALGNIACPACSDGYWAVYGSQEMSRTDIAARVVAYKSGMSPSAQMTPNGLTNKQSSRFNAAVTELEEEWLMRTLHGCTVQQLRLEAERLQAMKEGMGVVVLDYLQITPVTLARKSANRTDELEYLSKAMKAIALDLDCIAVTLSQPTAEASRSKKVRAADGKGAQAIQADADAILVPYLSDAGDARLTLDKWRHGPFPRFWDERVMSFDSNRIAFTGSRV